MRKLTVYLGLLVSFPLAVSQENTFVLALTYDIAADIEEAKQEGRALVPVEAFRVAFTRNPAFIQYLLDETANLINQELNVGIDLQLVEEEFKSLATDLINPDLNPLFIDPEELFRPEDIDDFYNGPYEPIDPLFDPLEPLFDPQDTFNLEDLYNFYNGPYESIDPPFQPEAPPLSEFCPELGSLGQNLPGTVVLEFDAPTSSSLVEPLPNPSSPPYIPCKSLVLPNVPIPGAIPNVTPQDPLIVVLPQEISEAFESFENVSVPDYARAAGLSGDYPDLAGETFGDIYELTQTGSTFRIDIASEARKYPELLNPPVKPQRIVHQSIMAEGVEIEISSLSDELSQRLELIGAVPFCTGALAVVKVTQKATGSDQKIDDSELAEILKRYFGRVLISLKQPHFKFIITPQVSHGGNTGSLLQAGGGNYKKYIGLDKLTSEENGSGVTIAVLDTGYSGENDSVTSRGVMNPNRGSNSSTSGAPTTNAPTADDYKDRDGKKPPGHGTPIAHLALEVAPKAKVLSIKTCDEDGECRQDDVIMGLCYALATQAPGPDEANTPVLFDDLVFNLSFGSDNGQDEITQTVLRDAMKLGVLVASSGGNIVEEEGEKRYEYGPFYPASHFTGEEGLVGITALDCTTGSCQPSNEFTKGNHITVAAPGVGLPSTDQKGTSQSYTGTSFSTPLVAGTLALMRQAAPKASPAEIEKCLIASARMDNKLIDVKGAVECAANLN